MRNDRTNYSILYEFEYKGNKESFDYDIPFDIFVNGIRKFFSNNLVDLDGTDNAIWNSFAELGEDALDNLFYAMEDWFKAECAEAAEEEFLEWAHDYLDDEE